MDFMKGIKSIHKLGETTDSIVQFKNNKKFWFKLFLLPCGVQSISTAIQYPQMNGLSCRIQRSRENLSRQPISAASLNPPWDWHEVWGFSSTQNLDTVAIGWLTGGHGRRAFNSPTWIPIIER